MKANELMVGDYLKAIFTHKTIKVKEIKQNCIYTEDNGYEYNEIEPIPLTHEILEKNGFTLEEEEKGMYGVTISPYYTRDDVPFEVFCDGEPFAIWFKDPVNIKYVHELQRALRLCGITREIII